MTAFAYTTRNPLANPLSTVRMAEPTEHAAIVALLLQANRQYRDVLPVRIYDAYLRDLRELAGSYGDKDFMVAELEGRLAGTVAFYPDASAGDCELPKEWAGMRALAVDPELRGRGIGRQLAEACVLRAWRDRRPALCLHNAAFQSVARKLYLAMGFRRCPQYDFDVGDLPELDLKGERLAIDAFCLDLKQ